MKHYGQHVIIKQRDKINTHMISELVINSTLNLHVIGESSLVENFLYKHKNPRSFIENTFRLS